MNNPDIILTGTVRHGQRYYHKPMLVQKIIDDLEGQEFEEIIKKKEKGKTHLQLAYYYGGIIKKTCMQSTLFEGWTEKEIDAFFKDEFLTYYATKSVDGVEKDFPVVEGLSKLTTQEMGQYTERVIQWLAEHDIIVLTPDEYRLNKYEIKSTNSDDEW